MNAADFVNDLSNRGPFEGFTHTGVCGEPGNGPFTQFWLEIEDGVVTRCHYGTHGCMWSIACAGLCARLATGRPVERTFLIEPHDLDLILGGLPEGKGECAGMAVRALRSALAPLPDSGEAAQDTKHRT